MYVGSFADGFIKAFLAAQNLQMHRQYYAMRAQMYNFQMKQAGYDPQSGKWWSWKDQGFTAPSYQAMMKGAMDYAQSHRTPLFQPYGQGGGDQAPNKNEDPTIRDHIIQKSLELGKDPKQALNIWRAESGGGTNMIGDGGSSFSDFQLHKGGINPDMPKPGVGDMMLKDTKKDPADPANRIPAIDYALEHAAKNGWGDWSTAKKFGYDKWDDAPPQSQATTTPGVKPSAQQPTTAIPPISPGLKATGYPDPNEKHADLGTGSADPTWLSFNTPANLQQQPQQTQQPPIQTSALPSPTAQAIPDMSSVQQPVLQSQDGGDVTQPTQTQNTPAIPLPAPPQQQNIPQNIPQQGQAIAEPQPVTGYSQQMNQYRYMLQNTPSLWSLGAAQAQPIPTSGTLYATGGPVLRFADGGSVDSESNWGSDYGLDSSGGDDIQQQEFQDNYDDNQLQQMRDQGPSEGGLPLGEPQISDNYGNPSRGVTDGVTSGARALSQEHSMGGTNAVPTQDQTQSQNTFNSGENAVEDKDMTAIYKAVDPDGQLSPQMRNLAAIESMYKYGLLTGHQQDAASAIGSTLIHLRESGKQYGLDAVEALSKGDMDKAVGNIINGYNQVPDGMLLHATPNKDGTYHVEQTDLHGKPVWQKDVGKQELMVAAHGLASGLGFWSMLGKNMSKYDPQAAASGQASGQASQPDPQQADYARAEQTMDEIGKRVSSRYFDPQNDPIVGNQVVRHPQPPALTGTPVDRILQEQYRNDVGVWQGYRQENQARLRDDLYSARSDFMTNFREQQQMRGIAAVQERKDQSAAERQQIEIQREQNRVTFQAQSPMADKDLNETMQTFDPKSVPALQAMPAPQQHTMMSAIRNTQRFNKGMDTSDVADFVTGIATNTYHINEDVVKQNRAQGKKQDIDDANGLRHIVPFVRDDGSQGRIIVPENDFNTIMQMKKRVSDAAKAKQQAPTTQVPDISGPALKSIQGLPNIPTGAGPIPNQPWQLGPVIPPQ